VIAREAKGRDRRILVEPRMEEIVELPRLLVCADLTNDAEDRIVFRPLGL